ncbi:MAG: tRNA uridine(34) 5-carboxymethylaminomethyl modification radical SAM/GNAT enzyme Elp3 [Candidatus Aenigmarchaeota archaeon]|nr:tRNA uridine(34) 5-carboxymethylaminomethyl modification radical SAM/GNAT enzyme Elp3 [Candidatus Aenigmarchaeota archaeon]
MEKKLLRSIIEELKKEKLTREKVWVIVKRVCKRYKVKTIPTSIQILQACKDEEREKLEDFLVMKPGRTISGVSVITVVPKPAKCPGVCIYCPRGENAPQSYIGLEPAIQRAIQNNYDPFSQVKCRIKQYTLMGHDVDKVELIIIGGTFLALEKEYQEWFVKRLFDALNGKKAKSLEEAIKLNEEGRIKCSGLAIETRPDFCFEEHINQMLKLATTRVEIGVQSIYPEILKKAQRIHSIEDVIKATQLAKDSCLKVTWHIMPGLFTSFEEDLKQFKEIFENPEFRPDSLKIYPTLVIKGTKLYEMWKKGYYKPLEENEAIELIARALEYIPKYCRVIRVQRDIPASHIVAGVKKSNLREFVERRAEELGISIKEIRYREVGHKLEKGVKVDFEKIKLCRVDYEASGGDEIFLSFEDVKNDVLIAFLRLRIPFKPFRKEITEKTALVRELHVYGPLVPVDKFKEEAFQHKGFGKKLLEEAEKISKEEFDKNKIVVISGAGVKRYYYKLGYKQEGAYVSKLL